MTLARPRNAPRAFAFILGCIIATTFAFASPARAATLTWIVTSTADTAGSCGSTCTLRAAIAAANASAGTDEIRFAISPDGPKTIGVATQLPTITGDDVVVDGSTQPGGGARGIHLTDLDKSGSESGFAVAGDRVTIRGFAITAFDEYLIHFTPTASGGVVAGNYLGTLDGVTDGGARQDGIKIQRGGPHVIGGATAADRNVISGNNHDGINIEDSSDNVVVGNYIGMTADGVGRIPNFGGIEMNGLSSRNRIGGTSAGERNVVSGNEGIGVQILGSLQADGTCETPRDNVIIGNYLGVNVNGDKPGSYGNRGEGAQMSVCATNNRVGGSTPEERNIISSNHADGVELDSSGGPGGTASVCGNLVQGNFIGLDPTGLQFRPNVDDGIGIDNGACNNLIGGDTIAAGNHISGNFNDGIDIARLGSNGNVVRSNVIGLGVDGRLTRWNNQNGILVRSRVKNTTIEDNVISANLMSGIKLMDTATENNTIRNNKVGTDVGGSLARGNKQYGIWIYGGARNNLVESNAVANNTLDGIAVEATSSLAATGNRLTRNTTAANGGLGIDLLPVDGVNANNGTDLETNVGNSGIDYPVVTAASTASIKGTARAGRVVEVFAASGDSNGEGTAFLGSTTAAADGSWCLAASVSSSAVTATARDGVGNTSEYAENRSVSGTENLCTGGGGGTDPPPPSDTVLLAEDFTGPNGTVPAGWEVRRSAAGTGAGATIQDDRFLLNVSLNATQVGFVQYVQARETPVKPDWASATHSFKWHMRTATSNETISFVLAPTAATGNVLSTGDYLRIRVINGALSIVRRTAGGGGVTLWSGNIVAGDSLRSFDLRIDGSTLSLFEGAPGAESLRVGNLNHGLSFGSGYAYLHGSTSQATPFAAIFDNVQISRPA